MIKEQMNVESPGPMAEHLVCFISCYLLNPKVAFLLLLFCFLQLSVFKIE